MPMAMSLRGSARLPGNSRATPKFSPFGPSRTFAEPARGAACSRPVAGLPISPRQRDWEERPMTRALTDRIPLGRTGIAVSPVCFGAAGIGDMPASYGYPVGEDRAKATLHAIFDGPSNFLDT